MLDDFTSSISTLLFSHSMASEEQIISRIRAIIKPKRNENSLAFTSGAMERILAMVSEHYEVSPEIIKAHGRSKSLVPVRNLAIYLTHEHTGCSYSEIAAFYEGRCHATIIYSCKYTRRQMENNSRTRYIVNLFSNKLRNEKIQGENP